ADRSPMPFPSENPRELGTSGLRTCHFGLVDLLSALFEGFGKLAERLVEHRSHQQAEHPAGKLVGDEEADLASARIRLEAPAVLEIAERPVDIFDKDLEIGGVQRHAAGEGLADRLVA